MRRVHYGLVFAILSPFFSSIATILQSGATRHLHPLIIASMGGILGSLLLFIVILLTGEKINLTEIRKNLKNISLMTLLRPLAGTTIFVYGLSITEGIKAIFFTKAEPYFVLLWHWLLKKERVNPSHLILLAIHLAGAVILSTGGILKFGKAQFGDMLVILAMGFFSLSYIYGSKLSTRLGSKISNAITLGLGGIILFPLMLIFAPVVQTLNETIGWTYFISYVILFNVVGLTMWFASLKTVKGWIVSALRSLGPIIGAPFAWLLLGETLSVVQIIGGSIVLVTSALIAREQLRMGSKSV
ncbi:MAG: DMT family transporter [Candidatus Aenigmarchaeota archaeon]|nr:DMT family transporter [Candidatus Aenigmarchaeota archaeon]